MNTIKDFIHEKGLTQGQVAELLGYTQNYVNQVANGKIKPTPAFRWRWQEAFGGDALRVLDGAGAPATVFADGVVLGDYSPAKVQQ